MTTVQTVGAVLGDPATLRALRNSAILAGAAVALGAVLAITAAWLSARTTSPLRRIVTPTMVLLVAVSPLFYALSGATLDAAPINLRSSPGPVFVLALKVAAVAYLLIVGAVRAVDPALAEAARVAGASCRRAFLTVELPALAPALFSSVLVGAIVAVGTLDIARHAPLDRPAVESTIVIGLVAGFVAAALAVMGNLAARPAAWRRRRAGARPLLAVLGLGILAAVMMTPSLRRLHGTQPLNLVALIVAMTLIATIVTAGAAARVGRELAESVRTAGASAARAVVGTVVRLIGPSFAAAWLIASIVAVGHFDGMARLGSPTVRSVAEPSEVVRV